MSLNVEPTACDALSLRPLSQSVSPLPLVVDLDGTLIKTDSLVESFLVLMRQNFFCALIAPLWLAKGRTYLKQQISRRVDLDVSLLPYNQELLNYLKSQRDQGRRLVLATGADEKIAQQVADHLRLFDAILASNGIINLTAQHKRDLLVSEFGEKGFDYAGNGKSDRVIWSSANKAIVVGSSWSLRSLAPGATEMERVFTGRKRWLKPYIRALRLHQWLKNLLVFVPLIVAHLFLELDLLENTFFAFLSFGLCASGAYLINDLMDIPADRRHPKKRLRPFAAGELSISLGLISIPLLLAFSLLIALSLPPLFGGMLVIYYLLNLAYSFYLKRIALLDVVVLGGLYTLRLMAGCASIEIWPSAWLLAFSGFLFLSLALVKRYAELVTMGAKDAVVSLRGYRSTDKELLAALGSGSGFVAVLVLAIYISSGVAEIHYTRHQLVWFLCPLVLYWISYVWLVAHRGGMHDDDPLAFMIKDRVSWVAISLGAMIFALAI